MFLQRSNSDTWVNVFDYFLALNPILHNELISTKREIFAPRGPGVDAGYRNKRLLIEVFGRVSIRYARSTSTASIPQKRFWRRHKNEPSPVMNKQQPFDLKLKPSTLTFNNVSAIKRELENLLWHMVAAVWNLFSFSNPKISILYEVTFCKSCSSPKRKFLQSWEILIREIKSPVNFEDI